MLLTMKYALKDELPEKLAGILGLLRDMAEREKGLQYLEVLFRYLVQGTDKLSREDFERALTGMPLCATTDLNRATKSIDCYARMVGPDCGLEPRQQ